MDTAQYRKVLKAFYAHLEAISPDTNLDTAEDFSEQDTQNAADDLSDRLAQHGLTIYES